MTLRPSSSERASALVISVILGSLIGFTLLAYLSLVGNQNRFIVRSTAWNYAIAVAEAGVEEALTQLHNHPTNFTADGWATVGDTFVKSRPVGDGYYAVAISNVNPPVIYAQGFALIPNSTNYIPPRTVRVTTHRLSLFAKGMVAKGLIDLSGNNVMTDSFDSMNPSFSTWGRYDEGKAKDNGDVATNSTLTNSLDVGNANIRGHASTGPGGSAKIGPKGAVGSKAWNDADKSGIEPGYFEDDMNVSFPDVLAPFTGGTAPLGGTILGTNYAYVLGTGNYRLNSLSMSGGDLMLVFGQAILFVTGNVSLTGSARIVLLPTASLQLYVAGASAKIGGNGIANWNGNAANFGYYGLPSNTSLALSGNAEFIGMIYAPNADFTLGGGGSSDYDFMGASVTKTVKLNGHYKFHYDENLGRNGPLLGYVVKSWDEI